MAMTPIHKPYFAYKMERKIEVCTEICVLNWKQAVLKTDGGVSS